MQLPEYLFAENKDIPGIGLILCTRPPYNIGRPIRLESNEAISDFIIKYNILGRCAIIGPYNILIAWIGTISNVFDPIPVGGSVSDSALNDLNKMALFYGKEKIKGNETRLKRYLRTG